MPRELTYQETVLIQAVTEWNMLGKRPMYREITERIRDKIRVTDANRKRLQRLVKEGYLGLYGKRYYNPMIHETNPEPEEKKPGEIIASTEEVLAQAREHNLIFFLLNLRTYRPNELPVIVKWFKEEGLTLPVIRRLEIIVAILHLLMENYKSIPEVAVPESMDLVGTDIIDDIYRLIVVSK